MKKVYSILTYVAVVTLATMMMAQTSVTPTDAQVKSDSPDIASKPAPHTFFGQTFAGHWAFSADANYDQEYDDNIFSSGLVRLSDNVSRFSVRFSAAVQKKKLRMQLHYVPDYAVYSKYPQRNALSQQAYEEISYKWSGRTELNWTATGSRTVSSSNSPFQLVDFDGTFLPVFRPEALQNDATILNLSTAMSWSHRFSARSTLTATLDGNMVRFESANGVALSSLSSRKSFSSGANVRWDEEFIPGHKLGIEVSEHYFGFLDPGSHSNYQAIKARYSQDFGRNYHLSVGAGPSRRERQAIPGLATAALESTGYDMDASFTKSSERQNVGLSYSHGQQLGLTQGSIASDSVSVSMMRHVGRKWTAQGGFGYSRTMNENLLQALTTDSYSTNASIGYQLRSDLSFEGGYSYVTQKIDPLLPGVADFDRNVFRLGIRYTFQFLTSK